MTLTTALASEIQSLAPSAEIHLYELDASVNGGGVFLFHSGTNGLSQNIVWQGQTYVRIPIHITGFDFQGQGQFPRPRLQVSNALSAITTLLIQYKDLLRSKVTRRRTLVKFLDAVNFPGSVNLTADPTASFQDDVYYIDRKSSEDRDAVEFELASSLDLIGVTLPRRQIIQNICTWKYRGAECGYTGAPVFDLNDLLLVGASTTAGQTVIDTYSTLVNTKSALDIATLALTAARQAMDPACEMRLLSTRYNYAGAGVMTNGVLTTYDAYGNLISTGAVWGGANVTLGSTYRIGRNLGNDNNWTQNISFSSRSSWAAFEIGNWGADASVCTPATTAYNAASATYTAKLNAYNSAVTAHASALAALPANDPLYTRERCGKRLTSCKARFGATNELSFGSFPAAGLIR